MAAPHGNGPTVLRRADQLARGRALIVAVVVLAFTAALLSLLIGHYVCADARGWLAWGEQLGRLDGSFSTAVYPSWKPLPVLFTVPLALTGGAAPLLWLTIERTAGILALIVVFRLAWRLGGLRAGLVALLAIAIAPAWWATFSNGRLEPMLTGLLVLAVDRHLRGRRGQALGLATLVALGREEAFVLVAGYGVWACRRDPRLRPALAAALVLVPAAWLGGDYLGSGDPLHGGTLAMQAPDVVAQAAQGPQALRAVELVVEMLPLALWGTLAIATYVAARRRDRVLLALAAAAVAWIAFDVAIASQGYPAESRFLLPAAGLLAVLSGTGVAALSERVPARSRRQAPAWSSAQTAGEVPPVWHPWSVS